MSRRLLVEGGVTCVDRSGRSLTVAGRGDTVVVDSSSLRLLWALRSWRRSTQRWIDRSGVIVEFAKRGLPIAVSRPGDGLRIAPWGLLRAALLRR